jgi:steroid 5-alpha reductase family enzyme
MEQQWIIMIIVIEAMAIAGVISALITKDTKTPFIFGFNTLLPVTAVYCWYGNADLARKIMLLTMLIIYQLRMNVVLTLWYNNTAAAKLKEIMPLSSIYFLPVILANVFGWLYCLPFYWTADRVGPFNWVDYSAITVYLIGTIFHFGSDYQKHRFKQQPNTRGKILDTGFWRYSRHPNYFGDFLIYVSFGLTAGNPWGVIAPLTNIAQYMGDAIPKSEKMAEERYGEAWSNYKKKAKCLIPFVL